MANKEEQKNRKVAIGVSILGAVVSLLVVLLTPIANSYLSRPKLKGSVLLLSAGTTTSHPPIASLILFVSAKNPSDEPIVVSDIVVHIYTRNHWIRLPTERHTNVDQSTKIESSEKRSIEPLMPGDWTGCISGKDYLLGPSKINSSVSKEKPLSGILRSLSSETNLLDISRRQRLLVTVVGNDGQEYALEERVLPRDRSDIEIQQLLSIATWERGLGRKCER